MERRSIPQSVSKETLVAGLLMFIEDYVDDYWLEDKEHIEWLMQYMTHQIQWEGDQHCGDCTNVPMACNACIADEYLEKADTLIQLAQQKFDAVCQERE